MSDTDIADKTKSYKKIKEIFTEMSVAYAELGDRIGKQKHHMTDERSKLLLEWWQERVHSLRDSLQKYLDTGSETVMDTWIQYVPKLQMVGSFEEQMEQEEPDPDTVVDACENAWDELISLLKVIREQTTKGSVQKQLASYITLLEEEKKKLEVSKENFEIM